MRCNFCTTKGWEKSAGHTLMDDGRSRRQRWPIRRSARGLESQQATPRSRLWNIARASAKSEFLSIANERNVTVENALGGRHGAAAIGPARWEALQTIDVRNEVTHILIARRWAAVYGDLTTNVRTTDDAENLVSRLRLPWKSRHVYIAALPPYMNEHLYLFSSLDYYWEYEEVMSL